MSKKSTKIVEEVRAPLPEDLIDIRRVEVVDIVERVYGGIAPSHRKGCQYRPVISQFGVVYCVTCGIQMGNILPRSIMEIKNLEAFAIARERYLHGR